MADLDRMIATLDDKSDGFPSLDKSISVLLQAGYPKTLIAEHVENAHALQYTIATKCIDKRLKHD